MRIQAEQASQQASKASASKTRFLAAASHDLRQPLQAATLYAAMLRNSDSPQPVIVEKLDAAIASCSDLLNHLLLLSRLQSQRLKPEKRIISLADTLNPVIDEFRPSINKKGLSLSVSGLEAHYVFTDNVLLSRIMRNLITNASSTPNREKSVSTPACKANHCYWKLPIPASVSKRPTVMY